MRRVVQEDLDRALGHGLGLFPFSRGTFFRFLNTLGKQLVLEPLDLWFPFEVTKQVPKNLHTVRPHGRENEGNQKGERGQT